MKIPQWIVALVKEENAKLKVLEDNYVKELLNFTNITYNPKEFKIKTKATVSVEYWITCTCGNLILAYPEEVNTCIMCKKNYQLAAQPVAIEVKDESERS